MATSALWPPALAVEPQKVVPGDAKAGDFDWAAVWPVPIVAVERQVRCEGCGLKDYLVVDFHIPTAAERASMRIRRLAGVRYIRKVIRRDED